VSSGDRDERRTPTPSGETPGSSVPASFLERTAAAFAAPLLPHAFRPADDEGEEHALRVRLTRGIGERYAIERLAGRGGMAFVYLATDLRHGRHVAVKVMRPAVMSGRNAVRFAHEVRVAARLNHPHIVPLHDSGVAEGLPYYVMPYLEGESLRGRLSREHQLPVAEAVRIACEVADALDHAHRHDVLHRDVKPENVLLRDGHALVADFGIARGIQRAATDAVTSTGVTIGTPAYMSPEQLSSTDAMDGRSDIYSLACMLYEMLAGDPPHAASTPNAVVAKTLNGTFESVRTVRPSVPTHVDAALRRALARVPADRFASAAEFAAALRGTPLAVPVLSSVVEAPTPRSRGAWTLAVATMLLLGGSAISFMLSAPESVEPELHFSLLMPGVVPSPTAAGPAIAISHDDARIAVLARVGAWRGIVVRDMRSGELSRIEGADDADWLAFSSTGDSLLFQARNRLWLASVHGGAAAPLDRWVRGATWTDRGDIVMSRGDSIVRLSDRGGHRVTASVAGAHAQRYSRSQPQALPGGEWVLVSVRQPGRAQNVPTEQLAMVRVSDGREVRLHQEGIHPQYMIGDVVLYGEGDDMVHARAFSPWRRRFVSEPVVALRNVDVNHVAVSRRGTLLYLPGGRRERRVVLVDRSGRRRPLLTGVAAYRNVRLSPDGRRLAFAIEGQGIWVYDLETKVITRLDDATLASRPEWTPDGREVAWTMRVGPGVHVRILARPFDASAPARTIATNSRGIWEIAYGAPGGLFAVQVDADDEQREDVLVAPVDSPAAFRPAAATTATERAPMLTRDGRLLAYESDESGRLEVYALELSGRRHRVQVSSGGGRSPVWSADGRELFYRAQGLMMAARLRDGAELSVAGRDTLFVDDFLQPDATRPAYDLSADGRWFVMIAEADSTRVDTPVVILNWAAAMKRRLQQAAK
jgi:eukaryotic-like serine/threonine-protein kinase